MRQPAGGHSLVVRSVGLFCWRPESGDYTLAASLPKRGVAAGPITRESPPKGKALSAVPSQLLRASHASRAETSSRQGHAPLPLATSAAPAAALGPLWVP